MFDSFRLRLSLLSMALLSLGLAACGSTPTAKEPKDSKSWLSVISPYKIDKVQGNVITREQIAVLQAGMPRSVVKDILGTPLLTSVFHSDRWDYVFTFARQGSESQQRKVTVFFKGDQLDRFEADELPSEAEFVATLKSVATEGKIPPLEASPESLKKFPAATAAEAPATPVAPISAPANYPPLEPAK
jgi:outer membrane protein assembly factor BamE